jgi:ribonuclease HII
LEVQVKDQPTKGAIERALIEEGRVLAGIDEVGRGCLAGPVVAACVVLDYQKLFALDQITLAKIRDSKTLSAKQRAELINLIETISLDLALGVADPREIESIGILNATFVAMNRAVASLEKITPDILLVDGNQRIREQTLDQRTIVKGDSLCYAIAAASIVAKEHRDSYMRDCSVELPHWGFEKHVGYGTVDHLAAIKSHGICHLHRKNFAPIRDML